MVSQIIINALKSSMGEIIGFFDRNDFYFQGEIIACDDEFLQYNDRKKGIMLVSIADIKEVKFKR